MEFRRELEVDWERSGVLEGSLERRGVVGRGDCEGV